MAKNVSTSRLKVHYVVLEKIFFFLSAEKDSSLTEMFMPKEKNKTNTLCFHD